MKMKIQLDKEINVYTVTLDDKKEIKIQMSEELFNNLKILGIIDKDISIEEQYKQLEGYLLNAALKYEELNFRTKINYDEYDD